MSGSSSTTRIVPLVEVISLDKVMKQYASGS
jgi:hypothetical protein